MTKTDIKKYKKILNDIIEKTDCKNCGGLKHIIQNVDSCGGCPCNNECKGYIINLDPEISKEYIIDVAKKKLADIVFHEELLKLK